MADIFLRLGLLWRFVKGRRDQKSKRPRLGILSLFFCLIVYFPEGGLFESTVSLLVGFLGFVFLGRCELD